MAAEELLIARNPDPESTLAYLLRVPLGDGHRAANRRHLAAHQGALLLPGAVK